MSQEEIDRIARKVLRRRKPLTPADQERAEAIRQHTADLEKQGRPHASEDQVRIWQAWGESEISRIERESGHTT
ncbi:hypothetical protein ACFROC_00575 [Nocardia tengchongensis]|uniref:hypothetical protein n=1 Tax=Nocardia tengchongensis TaxID=2055889 RepID=UPI0036A19F7C